METKVAEFRKKFDKEVKSGLLSMLVMLAIDRNKGPSYGYQIIRTLETASGGKFKFQEGTIYPILSTLSEKGMLNSSWGESLEGPRRKYYHLTPEGKKALTAIMSDWSEVARTSQDIIEMLEAKK